MGQLLSRKFHQKFFFEVSRLMSYWNVLVKVQFQIRPIFPRIQSISGGAHKGSKLEAADCRSEAVRRLLWLTQTFIFRCMLLWIPRWRSSYKELPTSKILCSRFWLHLSSYWSLILWNFIGVGSVSTLNTCMMQFQERIQSTLMRLAHKLAKMEWVMNQQWQSLLGPRPHIQKSQWHVLSSPLLPRIVHWREVRSTHSDAALSNRQLVRKPYSTR